MEKRIELERRGRRVDEIVELNLDNCRSTQIAGLTDEFTKLETLSLINVGLTTLKGFPALPSLKKLELSDNRISTGLNFLHGCPQLTYINLSGNKIKDITSLEPLKALPELCNLDLFNCEVSNLENYRDAVFDLIEGLQYLDGTDRDNEEAEDDDSSDPGAVNVGTNQKNAHDLDESESDDDEDSDDDDDDDDEDDDEDDEDDIVDGEDGEGPLEDSVAGILDDDEDDGEDSEDEDDEGAEGNDATVPHGTKRKLEDEENGEDDGEEEEV